jgi:hypothetical protein
VTPFVKVFVFAKGQKSVFVPTLSMTECENVANLHDLLEIKDYMKISSRKGSHKCAIIVTSLSMIL